MARDRFKREYHVGDFVTLPDDNEPRWIAYEVSTTHIKLKNNEVFSGGTESWPDWYPGHQFKKLFLDET